MKCCKECTRVGCGSDEPVFYAGDPRNGCMCSHCKELYHDDWTDEEWDIYWRQKRIERKLRGNN